MSAPLPVRTSLKDDHLFRFQLCPGRLSLGQIQPLKLFPPAAMISWSAEKGAAVLVRLSGY